MSAERLAAERALRGGSTRGPRPELRTERLLLRPFRVEDGPAVERIAGAFEIADTTLTVPHPYPEGGGAKWIATHAPAWERGEQLVCAVVPLDDPDALVGAVGLGIDQRYAMAELGYWVAVERWGQGIATEAARALVHHGFAALGLHRIQARHLVRNAASGRVMEKIGMRREGLLRGALRKWDRYEDVALYAILATDDPARAPAGGAGAGAALQLRRAWDHVAWADAALLAALDASGDALPPGALREYAHVLGAAETWLSRLEGRPSRTAVWPDLAFADLAPLAADLRAGYARYLQRTGDDDLAREVTYTNSAGQTFATAIGDILMHAALHGQYHRGKVNLMLRQAGLQPAPVDFISFVRGVPAATTPVRQRSGTGFG